MAGGGILRRIGIALGVDVEDKEAKSNIESLKNFAKNALGTIAVGVSIVKVNALAEEFGAVNQMIKTATKEMLNQTDAQSKILAAANATRSSYADTAKVVSALVQENKDLFGTLDEAIKFNNAATQLFKTAGKTDEEIAEIMESINVSFARGAVDSETIGQLLEKSPEAAALLEKKLGASKEAFEQMASDGQISLQQLKEAFTDSADEIEKSYMESGANITDAIKSIRNQWGLYVSQVWEGAGISQQVAKLMIRAFSGFMAVLNKAQPAITSALKTAMNWMTRIADWISRVGSVLGRLIEHIGGVENAIKLVLIVSSALWLALNFGKIIAGINMIKNGLRGLPGLFNPKNLKIAGFVAAVTLIVLALEDFFNFLKGNDSVIGIFFDKIGVGADKARQTIFSVFRRIKTFLEGIWEFLGQAVTIFLDTVNGFVDKHGESIRATFERAWGIVKTFLHGVWTVISNIARVIFGSTEDSISNSTQDTREALLSIWRDILNALSVIFGAVLNVAIAAFNRLLSVAKFVFGLVQKFWEAWGSDILSWFRVLWDSLSGAISGFLDVLQGVASFISSVFAGDWSGAWEAIKQIFSGAWESIKNIAAGVLKTLQFILKMALSAIKSVITAVLTFILSFISRIAKGILGVIKGILGFIKTAWLSAWSAVQTVVVGILRKIVATIIDVLNSIKQTVSNNLQATKAIWTASWEAIIRFFTSLWNGAVSFLQGVWSGITGIISGAINGVHSIIATVLTAIWDFLTGIFGNIVNASKNTFENVLSSIHVNVSKVGQTVKDGFRSAIDFITSLPSQALQWGKDFIAGLKNGILSGISGITEAVSGIAGKVRSFLHFSRPDEGPLADYESWMPDFVDGLAKTLRSSKDVLRDTIRGLSETFEEMDAEKAWGKIVDTFRNGISAVKNIVSKVKIKVGSEQVPTETIGDGKSIIQQVSKKAKEVADGIKSSMSMVKQVIGDINGSLSGTDISENIEKMSKAFSNGMKEVKTSATGVMYYMRSNWQLLGNILVNPVSGGFNFIYNHCSTFRNYVDGFLNGIEEKWKNGWNSVKEISLSCWTSMVGGSRQELSVLKATIRTGFQSAIDFITLLPAQALRHGKNFAVALKEGILSGISGIKDTISAVVEEPKKIRARTFTMLKDVVSVARRTVAEINNALNVDADPVVSRLVNAFRAGANGIKDSASVVTSYFRDNWKQIGDLLESPISKGFELVYNHCSGFRNFINGFIGDTQIDWSGGWTMIKEIADSAWAAMTGGARQGLISLKSAIRSGMTDATSFIKGLPNDALKWGSDIIDGIASGIRNATGKVTNAVKGVADRIRSFLHFSRPDEGPLVDYETWMPDFVGGLARTLKENKGLLTSAALDVSRALNITPTVNTTAKAVGNVSRGNTINQKVEINNTVKTTDAKAGREASKQLDRSSNDVTKKIADGLAYGRA